jgi:hypothetical protein
MNINFLETKDCKEDEIDYQLSLYYFYQGNKERAIYWLKTAANRYHFQAIDLLQEVNTTKHFFKNKYKAANRNNNDFRKPTSTIRKITS